MEARRAARRGKEGGESVVHSGKERIESDQESERGGGARGMLGAAAVGLATLDAGSQRILRRSQQTTTPSHSKHNKEKKT